MCAPIFVRHFGEKNGDNLSKLTVFFHCEKEVYFHCEKEVNSFREKKQKENVASAGANQSLF